VLRKQIKTFVPEGHCVSKEDRLPVGSELSIIIRQTARKNMSHRAVPFRTRQGKLAAKSVLSASSRALREYVCLLCKDSGWPARIDYGEWAIEIFTYWKTVRHLPSGDGSHILHLPNGDIDAPVTPILDAVKCAAFDDDARISPLTSDRAVDKDDPRILVTVLRHR